MTTRIAAHYGRAGSLTASIQEALRAAGKDLAQLTVADLATVDEFHIRGRPATLDLANRLELTPASHVLDLGSGLGGAARTVAATYGCQVTGIDLTRSFCEAATALSTWVGLAAQTRFVHGDATAVPFASGSFDAVMTIHAAMNIAAKDALYAEAKRVLKPGGIFAIYDVLQGDGGPVVFPVPWAREPAISQLATPEQMRRLLTGAGFAIVAEEDSTDASLAWFQAVASRAAQAEQPPVVWRGHLGDDYPQMARNQVRNLTERRIRTVTFVCRA
jgi:ubiquinone/menaquinone biosynthesis C-methylase UbiE